MRNAPSVAGLVLALISAGLVRAEDATRLRWRFEKGVEPAYTMSQDVSASTDFGGQKSETTQRAVFGYSFAPTGSENDVARLDMRYDRVQMAMKTPFMNFEYDSKDPEKGRAQAGPVAGLLDVFDALVGAPFKLSVGADGKIVAIDMPEVVAKKLETNVPGAMAGAFGKDGMRQTVSLAFLPTPSSAVRKGDTWKGGHQVETPMGKMSYDVTYTYLGPEEVSGRALEKIAVKTTVAIEPSPSAPFALAIKSQESAGTALFDNAAGRLHSLEEVVKLNLEISVAGSSVVQSTQTTYKIAESKGDDPKKAPGEGGN